MLACAKLGATMQGCLLIYDMFQVFYHPSSKNTNIHCIYGKITHSFSYYYPQIV